MFHRFGTAKGDEGHVTSTGHEIYLLTQTSKMTNALLQISDSLLI